MAAKQKNEQKELRKMSRTELIEIIYALQQNEKVLRAEIADLNEKLNDKEICLETSGSIAEASLKLNRIFEDAENAAKQYVDSVKANADKLYMSNPEMFTGRELSDKKGEAADKKSEIPYVEDNISDEINEIFEETEHIGDGFDSLRKMLAVLRKLLAG